MAIGVDLNWPPDEGDEDVLLDLNEAPDDEGQQHKLKLTSMEVMTTKAFPLISTLSNLKNT